MINNPDIIRRLIRAIAEGESTVDVVRTKLERCGIGKEELHALGMNMVVLRTDMDGCVWHWFNNFDQAKKLVIDAYNACVNDPTFEECFLSQDQTHAWMVKSNPEIWQSPTVEFAAGRIFE